MEKADLDFGIERLGECTIPSPIAVTGAFVDDSRRLLYHNNPADVGSYLDRGMEPPGMELAGPRKTIFFDPSKVKCGIVTCGGLCPGLNDVVRAIVLGLFYQYGVTTVYGFRYGYEGLTPRSSYPPIELTPQAVSGINKFGGSVLGSSRGPQPVSEMVETLQKMGVAILFAVGGDGTLKGASAIASEAKKRGLNISVIGIPKTIDNDISYIDRAFGFLTAGSEARKVVAAAHSEARGYRNGIGLVKLMGRDSGFIAAYAALAASEVDLCLVPEVPFALAPFLDVLQKRIERKGHAVVVVAEGAGKSLFEGKEERDASGNVRFGDIGILLREKIKERFARVGMELNLKYIDPSYTIRSVPPEANDAAFCVLLGFSAAHAGMAGRTNMMVGHWQGEFTHLPIPLAVSRRQKLDLRGWAWSSVLAMTGQPPDMS